MTTSTENVLLNIVTLPAIEESLADWLLAREDISGFSSNHVRGHGTHHSRLNMSEQVAGQQQQILIQIQTTRSIAETIISELRHDFAGTDMHYWLLPVLATGHFADKEY